MELTRKQIILNCEKLERRFALLAGGKLEEYIVERENDDVNRIRSRFLDALRHALTEDSPITLDFVYGEIDDDVEAEDFVGFI